MAVEYKTANIQNSELLHLGEPRVDKVSQKRTLYQRARGRCEHPGGCDVTDSDRLTIDNFTPKCTAKAWGWSNSKLDSVHNCQLLCVRHHREKDASTPDRFDLVMKQINGKRITLTDLSKI